MTGGAAERQLDLFKGWAARHELSLRDVLGTRYVVFREWLFAKQTMYYDALPHYFLEFDVVEKASSRFLATEERRSGLDGLPIVPVPILGGA